MRITAPKCAEMGVLTVYFFRYFRIYELIPIYNHIPEQYTLHTHAF